MRINTSSQKTSIVKGEEAQSQLLNGVNELFDPVASTLGASGRTVIIEDISGKPKPTKDGVTVAKSIELQHPVQRMGCDIIKQASLNTAEEAGDGTTTSTILAKGIIERGLEAMKDKSINYTDFNKGMNIAVQDICDKLKEDSTKVNLSSIINVATISANNDEELGGIIAKAFKKAGKHGVVIMDDSETSETYVSITEGFELEKGYKSEAFITNREHSKSEYDDALILVSNVKIEKIAQIEPLLEYAIINLLPIVIVSEMEDDVLATLAVNMQRGNIKACVVEPSMFGVRRREVLTDLAVSTGATLIDDQNGETLENLTFEGLGRTAKVTAEKTKTVFINPITEDTKEHIELLKGTLKASKSKGEKAWLENRIAKLSSAVSVINVGASSETEQSEKADRVDDAINATRAALEEGIVAGGGIGLHNIFKFGGDSPAMKNNAEFEGYTCVMRSILDPLRVILSNADINFADVSSNFNVKNKGCNVKTGEYGDMFEMKIIDPVKVTKTALINAVSAASTLLSTTSVITLIR